ncbi:T9SS type A sorting domain-containing protein [candidate division KSB1 bacterium]
MKIKKTVLIIFGLIISLTIQAQNNYQGQLGYGLSPNGHPYDYSQFGAFLDEVANTCVNGGVAFANGAWRDSYSTSGKIPNVHKTVSLLQPTPYDYTDMINFGWRSGSLLHLNVPGNNTNNWTNDLAKSLFLNMLIHAADSLTPTYMFIGNETSRYWELDSVDYLNWVSFYHKAYDSIKSHSPSTKVGTVFNYEHLSGKGELTGFTTPYWQAFDAHDTSKIDILGLTVYPFFHDSTANDIPVTYLDPIFTRLGNKALAITETGWPSDSFIGTWSCSPAQQVDYVNKLFNIIDGKNVEVVNWLFLHYSKDTTDTDADKIFRSVSLRDSLGIDQPALSVWLSKCNQSSSSKIGFKNNASTSFSIFPNPVKDILTISSKEKFNNCIIKMYGIRGELLIENRVDTYNKHHINMTNYANGIYFIEVCQDKSVSRYQFIKN